MVEEEGETTRPLEQRIRDANLMMDNTANPEETPTEKEDWNTSSVASAKRSFRHRSSRLRQQLPPCSLCSHPASLQLGLRSLGDVREETLCDSCLQRAGDERLLEGQFVKDAVRNRSAPTLDIAVSEDLQAFAELEAQLVRF